MDTVVVVVVLVMMLDVVVVVGVAWMVAMGMDVVVVVLLVMAGCLVGCLTSQQHACVYQGRICSNNCTCCHTELEVADQTFYLTQSQYTDTGLTSPIADPVSPG